MKKETINKNKLITILCAVALTLGVLVSAVLFSVTPVHAGLVDSIPEGYNSIEMSSYNKKVLNDGESSEKYTDFPQEISESITMYIPDDVYIGCYQKDDYLDYNISNRPVTFILLSRKPFTAFYYIDSGSNAGKIWSSVASYNTEHGYYFNATTFKKAFGSVGQSDFSYSHVAESKFSHDVYTYSTDEELYKYFCDVADKKIDTAIPDVQDISDESYSFTGFTMNGKIARWTGTTERSHLKDQEVEEYTRITYGFATSEDQTLNADNFTEYDQDFAVGEKQMTIPWSDIESNKKDGEFIRQVNFIPCYRIPGAFYLGKGVKVFYKSDGSIDKIEYAQKQTDLNTGNMIFDSSIGYLQNVIYTEEKTHDGKGRQATFKWSTSKALPDDAQVEIVAQNFYIEWFNKKTEENFIYKEYGEDCIYKNGSFSFNANTPVWTWLNEKEIDPFSVKTQSYGTKEYYLRIVTYNEKDSMYHYGGWVRVNVKSKDATNMPTTDVETGGFDDDSGLWNKDSDSDDSYHYSTDDKGDLTGNISVSDWEDLNINSFTWMYRNLQSMVQSLGQLPTMVSTIFGFLPNQVITALSVLLIAVVLMRFLGR